MPIPELHIVPESARDQWLAHEWHQQIEDFSLPEKDLVSLTNAIVTRSEYLGPERAKGGVYSAEGVYQASSCHLRRSKDLTAGNPHKISVGKGEIIKGRYLYLGWFFNHYGHFMLESLSRAWALAEVGNIDGVVMHLHAADAPAAPYLMAFFDLLSIPREKVIFVLDDLQIETLLLPSQQAVLSRAISPQMLSLYRLLGRRAVAIKGQQDTEKLYISRRLLPDDQRKASNEATLEACFQEKGYRVVHPQFMDVISQLALFSGAKYFAGMEGSGLHNILFSQHPVHVWMLAAKASVADAVTQVYLGKICVATTELHLQDLCASSCLHHRVTPVLVQNLASNEPCLSSIKTTAYERFTWLGTLARQMTRRKCSLQADESLKASLTEQEQRVLRSLMNEAVESSESGYGDMEDFLMAEQAFADENFSTACTLMEKQLPGNEAQIGFLERLAEMFVAANRKQDALDLLEKAVQQDPDNPGLFLQWLGLLDAKQQQALPGLEILSRRYPRCFPLQIKLAEILAAKGQFDQAAVLLQQLIKNSTRHHWLHARLTWYWFKSGDYEEAKNSAHQALLHQPDNPFSFTHLARIHLALDQPEKSLLWVERAIERSPDNTELQQLRKKILDRQVRCPHSQGEA